MSDRFRHLSNLHIAKPCHADWEAMSGDEKKRHCAACDKKVHNLSEMTAEDAEAIVSSGRKVCVRYLQDNRGRIITKTALVASAVLMASTVSSGCTTATASSEMRGKVSGTAIEAEPEPMMGEMPASNIQGEVAPTTRLGRAAPTSKP